MKRLTIKNVGPVKDVTVELSRFNFFIGPQSSGKSTVAKIFSTCIWMEKEYITSLGDPVVADGAAFVRLVEGFHKMEGYFCAASVVEYESDFLLLHYDRKDFRVSQKESEDYHRIKVCYIPSERNMVTLPELQGFEFGQTNLRSFLFDWFNAREFYSSDNKTDVLGLGVKYFYNPDEQRQKDRIEHINGETYAISLGAASSGLQSVIPLLVMLQYYTGEYFQSFENKISFELDLKTQKLQRKLIDEKILNVIKPGFLPTERNELISAFNERLHNSDAKTKKFYKSYKEALNRLTIPVKSSFIIEEPEQNLYPDTQMKLLDSIVSLCGAEDKTHDFLITTHSPYILNQLNLMVRRHDVGVSGINWDNLSVWAIEDGKVKNLKLKNARLVDPEYLSAPLDHIYDQYERY